MKHGLLAAAAALALTGCATIEEVASDAGDAVAEATDYAARHNAAFEQIGRTYLDAMTDVSPVFATQIGDHANDADLPDITAAGRAQEETLLRGLLAAMERVDFDALSKDNQVDYRLLENQLQYQLWQLTELREWEWNPQYYHNIASYSLYGLISRDFAPWPERFANLVARMEKVPALFEQARAELDIAKVPQPHAEVVAQQTAGILSIVDSVLLDAEDVSASERSRYDTARVALEEAVSEHQEWLLEEVEPNAKGDFRLGSALYDRKMSFALMSDMDRATLKGEAEAAFDAIRAEMAQVSRTQTPCGGQVAVVDGGPVEQQELISCALELSYANRPARDEVMQIARATLKEATEFAAEKGFVTMPDAPVEIIVMPEFWQGNAVAYLDSPAPLEKHLPAYYAISPIPAGWTDEQATSFLKEYNTYMLHELSIHEGVPGHYLQINLANRDESVLRAVLMSGPFVEGWAVYSEEVMADEGYLGGDPLFRMTMLKMRLRAVTNTLLDIGIHTEGMTREEAMELMMEGAFQQEREAAGKWVRAQLSSVQLLSYFNGYVEHVRLREEAEARWGDDFDLKAYHDAVLGHGSPPAKYVRALMWDDVAVE